MLRLTSFVLCLGLLFLGATLSFASEVSAQVFDSGPSDPALFSTVINLPPDPNIGDFASATEGTQLNVADGGSVGNSFNALSGSEVNVSGGSVDGLAANSGSEVNISGGTVGSLDANSESVVNVSGGTVDLFAFARSKSVVDISGGTVGAFYPRGGAVTIRGGTVDFLNPTRASEISVSGGHVASVFTNPDCIMNISGGTVENLRTLNGVGLNVNFFGTEFSLNGTPLTALVPNQAFAISIIEAPGLTGTLNDGTAFAFDEVVCCRALGSDSTFTVTLATPFLLGDITGDGLVNFLDISPFIALLSSGEFQAEADIDRNGIIDFLDITPFITILSSGQ